jgi:hypothetical protein
MSDNKTIRLFFAYILMAVGGLMTLLSGGCTVVWLGFLVWNIIGGIINGSVFNSVQVNAIGAAFGLTLIVGGLPLAIGVALIACGRKLDKDER